VRIRRVSLILWAAFLAAACDRRRDGAGSPTTVADSVPVVEVHVDTLPADSAYAYILRPLVYGNLLWLHEVQSPPFLHVVDITTGKRLRSVGRKGGGPGEFAQVASIFKRPGDDSTVWAWDYDALRLTGLPAFDPVLRPAHIRTMQFTSPTIFLFPFGPDRFIGRLNEHRPDSLRFVIYDGKGRVERKIATRMPGTGVLPDSVLEEVANGTFICPRPDGSGFWVTYPYAGRIQRFDSLGAFVDSLRVPVPTVEFMAPGPKTGVVRMERRRGFYKGCAWSSTHLFAVFSGEWDTDDAQAEKRFVHVFDRNGKLVRILHLDASIWGITVDAEGRHFYSTAMDVILRFEIDPIRP
jgi:hypothetical protein